MRTGIILTAVIAAVGLSGLSSISDAEARPRRGEQLTLAGYRVMVEPEIVEDFEGRLVTRSLHWKLRAVYTTRRGHEVLAHVRPKRGERGATRDNEVRVDRGWERTDYPRESRLFASYRKAKRRFDGLRRSPDITLLDGEDVVVDGAGASVHVDGHGGRVRVDGHGGSVHVDGGHAHVAEPTHPAPVHHPAPVGPTCDQVLLEMGHHPNHLDECRGVDDVCAVTLLRKGHHPNSLDNCKGVEATCAVQLLEAGHHPNHLDNCTPDLSPGCVAALFAANHHPNHLDNCRGVDDVCAETLLRQGQHPNHLDNCRRR